MAYKTNLSGRGASFQDLINNGFGIVTVMNPKIYRALTPAQYETKTAYQVLEYAAEQTPLCTLDTLKIANVTQEGPTKTITGGQYSNPLVKFGKSARLEMQDALGSGKAVEYLCGGFREWDVNEEDVKGLHFGEDFQGPKLIIGDSFFIERYSGKQVQVKIIFYQFLPDSIFNLTQDAEGDASVFDMNGDLLTTNILVGKDENGSGTMPHGVFYSIVEPTQDTGVTYEVTTSSAGIVSVSANPAQTGVSYLYSEDDGLRWNPLPTTALTGKTIDIRGVKDGNNFVVVNDYKVELPKAE